MSGLQARTRWIAMSVLIAAACPPPGTTARAASTVAAAQSLPGWHITTTRYTFAELSARLDAAVSAHGMNLVNAASASEGARAQGLTIPGNRVVGVFRNDFARRMLAASLPAGIEAPIRFYLTENPDGTATLAYRAPTTVLAPYMGDGGEALDAVARELDPIFEAIARQAAGP